MFMMVYAGPEFYNGGNTPGAFVDPDTLRENDKKDVGPAKLKCVSCGAPLREEYRFCPECGTPVAREV